MGFDRALNQALVALFAHEGSGLILSGVILLGLLAVLIQARFMRVNPIREALVRRLNFMSSDAAPTPQQDAQERFADAYSEADRVMSSVDYGAGALRAAWMDYKQTFVAQEDGVIASSTRARVFFQGAGDPGRAMEWWAGIFVAIGLIMTFLGIVAALGQATAAIGTGGSAVAMQRALAGLLGIAAAKFWTSIAGLGSSIALRLIGRAWRQKLEQLEDELIWRLDAGVRYVSPQTVALEQLAELRTLNAALHQALGGAAEPQPQHQPAPAPEPRPRLEVAGRG